MTTIPSMVPEDGVDWVAAAEAAARRFCGWHIAPIVPQTVRVRGRGETELRLPTLHLVDVHRVTVGDTVVPLATVSWTTDGLLAATGRTWNGVVEVDMLHGFEAGSDVAAIITQVAARAQASPTGAVRTTVGQVTVQHGQVAPGVAGGLALMVHERELLEPYRLEPAP